MVPSNTAHDNLHLSLSGFPRHFRAEPANGKYVTAGAKISIGSHGNPDISSAEVSKSALRQDAYDAVRLLAEHDFPSKNISLPAKLASPETGVQQCDIGSSGLVFCLRECTAECWLRSDKRQEIETRRRDGDETGLAHTAPQHPGGACPRNRFKGGRTLAPVDVHALGSSEWLICGWVC